VGKLPFANYQYTGIKFAKLEAGILGLYRDVNHTERVADILVPQVIKELPPTIPQAEKDKIVDNAEEMKKEIISLRAELEKLRREKEHSTKGTVVKKVTKRGPKDTPIKIN